MSQADEGPKDIVFYLVPLYSVYGQLRLCLITLDG